MCGGWGWGGGGGGVCEHCGSVGTSGLHIKKKTNWLKKEVGEAHKVCLIVPNVII